MKYLLDKNLNQISRCESLEDDKDNLVFDPDGKNVLKDLKAIAKANGIEHDSKVKLADLSVLITDAFSALDLPEQLDKKGIVVAGIKAGKTDDAIMMELINVGVHVRDAYGEFRTAMMAAGLLLRPKERNEKLAAVLDGFSPKTGDDVSDKLKELMDEIPRTTERQAMGAIRKYAKDNKIELPKVKRVGGWKRKLQDWIVENPTASVDDLSSYVSELGRPEQEKAANELLKAADAGDMKAYRELREKQIADNLPCGLRQ